MFEFSEMGAGALFMRGNDFKGQKPQGKHGENQDSISVQLLQQSKVTTITDNGSTQSHLRAIAASKRQKSQSQQAWNPDIPKNTWRKRHRPLFQYKHYSEQQPLRLSNSEIEEVLAAFCVEGSAIGGSQPPGYAPLLPVSHPSKMSFESADVAGSVLIKLIIDMYMANPLTATPLTLSMLEGMLGSSTVAVRTRCFDLLLNLGIHAHLLEPMQIEEQSALEEEAMEASALLASAAAFSSSRRGLNLEEAFRAEEKLELLRPQEQSSSTFKVPVEKVDGETPEAVKRFEIWLLQILFEMLLYLVQTKEKEEAVWAASLSCLFYFICDGSRVKKHRLWGIDIRVLKSLLSIGWQNKWADELQCMLVCMMSHLLYKVAGAVESGAGRKAEFDMEQLELLGGIQFICVEYARAKSLEAKSNLFAVVLDYVLLEVNSLKLSTGTSQLTYDDIQGVVGALLLGDAAEVFGFAFKHGVKNAGEGLFRAIVTAMPRDIDSGRLNAGLLQEVAAMFDGLVASFVHPDEEFMDLVSFTMAISSTHGNSPGDGSVDPNTASQAWATLNALLHSSKLLCRLHGYSWLIDLLVSDLAHGSISIFDNGSQQHVLSASSNKEAEGFNEKTLDMIVPVHLFYGLLRSKHAMVRRGFVAVLERLLVSYQKLAMSSFLVQQSEGESKEHEGKSKMAEKWETRILDLMNEALLQFVLANDANQVNILQMCDLIFSQLCITLPSSSSSENPSNTFIKDNLVFNRFGSYHNFSGRNFLSAMHSGKIDNKHFRNDTTDYRAFLCSKNQTPRSTSMAAMLLKGQAAAPRVLVTSIPTDLLYWPLLQLAGAATEDMTLGVAVGSQGRGRTVGGASDVRAALLVLLIGKCSAQPSAFEEVGGEEFFRSLLDDMDARVAYYTASFLLKRMMSEEPERYQRVLHTLVFRAQQCNNEKLLENPYLQMRGILQLSIDPGGLMTIPET